MEKAEKGGGPMDFMPREAEDYRSIYKRERSEWPLKALKIHPENARIYGPHDEAGLAESLKRSGLLHPIVITKKGEILEGARRFTAAKKLGWKQMPVDRILNDLSDLEVLRFIVESNQYRGKKSPACLKREAEALEKLFEAGSITKSDLEKMASLKGSERGHGDRMSEPNNLIPKAVGTSRKTLNRASYVLDAAKAEKEIKLAREQKKINSFEERELLDKLERARKELESPTKPVNTVYRNVKKEVETVTKTKHGMKKAKNRESVWMAIRTGKSFLSALKKVNTSFVDEEDLEALETIKQEIKDVL